MTAHWTRRRNLANSTPAAAAEWARGAPTSALVVLLAESAVGPGIGAALYALSEGPTSTFVDAARTELDRRVPPGENDEQDHR